MKEVFDYTNFTSETKEWDKKYNSVTEYTDVYVFDIKQFNLNIDDIMHNPVSNE